MDKAKLQSHYLLVRFHKSLHGTRPNRLRDILKRPIIVLVWLKMNIKVNVAWVPSVFKHFKMAEYFNNFFI